MVIYEMCIDFFVGMGVILFMKGMFDWLLVFVVIFFDQLVIIVDYIGQLVYIFWKQQMIYDQLME